MAFSLSTQGIANGQFTSPFTSGMAINGTTFYPAVALLTSLSGAGSLFDPATLVPSTSSPLVTPTITAGAYTAGQQVGPLMSFAIGATSGILESIRVTCQTVQTTALNLYIFDVNPTGSTWTDRSTPAIVAADRPLVRGMYSLASPASGLGTHTIWNIDGIACSFVTPTSTLYGVMIVVGTPTFGSVADLTVKLGIIDD